MDELTLKLKQTLAELRNERCIYPETLDGDSLRVNTVGVMLESIIETLARAQDRARYATRYTLHDGPVTLSDNPVSVEVRDGIGPDSSEVRRWAVTRRGSVWSKSAQAFTYEPSPSSRDDEFIADTRFDSLDEAWSVAIGIRESR